MTALFWLLAIPAMALLQGWILSLVWGWFVVPIGVAPIGVVHGIGIVLLVAFFRNVTPAKKVPQPIEAARVVCRDFLLLGLAWVAHLLRGAL